MGFYLRVDQRFRVSSAICQKYEEKFGPFMFIVEVKRLYRMPQTYVIPADGDLYLGLVEPGRDGVHWHECHCLSMGDTNYYPREFHYSPDLINGGDAMWYVPDLFRWQTLWCWLVGNDVVEFLG